MASDDRITSKSFKNQIRSDAADLDKYRTQTTSTKHTRGIVEHKPNITMGKPQDQMVPGMTTTAINMNTNENLEKVMSQINMTANVHSKENIPEKEKDPEVWNQPLSRYNTYTSHTYPKACMEVIRTAVDKFEKEKLVDWEIEGYNVFGRMYYGFDMSEYMINVYISSDNQYKSVIEIRRSSGDTFVHDEFFRRISKYLEDENVLERKEDVDFGLSLALEPVSLDSVDSELLKELTSKDEGMTSDDDMSVSEITDVASTQQLGDELIEVVTDRRSYREVFRHSSAVLCQELETNPQFVQYVASQKDIIQRLLKPLTEDLYDTLIIRNILQVVKKLLEYDRNITVYENCKSDITELRVKWAGGPHHQHINMRFGRSQQIERACLECLTLLKERS